MYNETIIAIEKQNFWKKLLKFSSLKMKICCFFLAAFCPTSTTYQPIWNYVLETASNKLLTSLLILQLLQHSSTAHLHCRHRRLQPHLLLTVYHQKELPRRLLSLMIPIRTTRFTSKCHPSGPHPNPTNTQWMLKSSVYLIFSSSTKFI